MKMKVIDRIILAFYAILSAVALFVVCVCFVGGVVAVDLESIGWMRPVSWLLLLGLIAWCVRLIVLQFKPDGSAPKNTAAVQSSEEGDVRVSVRAMETLARRAIAQSEEVLDSKLRIVNNDSSVNVEVDVVVGSDTHVPALTATLQQRVKGMIEEYAGVAVHKVVVLVTDIRETTPALPAPAAEPVQAVVVEAERVEVHSEPVAEADPAPVDGKADNAAAGAAPEEAGVEEDAAVIEAEESGDEEDAAVVEAEESGDEEDAAVIEAEEAEEEPVVLETEVADEWAETIGTANPEKTADKEKKEPEA